LVTDRAGRFRLEAPAGECVLQVAAVGYRPLSIKLSDLREGTPVELEVADPLRAVQSLPGVTSNYDFQSQFAVRGAGFQRTGIYLDGVLLHSPFHTLQGDTTSASLSIVEGEVLESATLYPSALPPPYGDRTAGALDLRTREGDKKQLGLRSTLSMSNAGATVEGPLSDRGSWLAAARKSYL
jgi:hypothetical protein